MSNLRRREFVALFGGATAWPLAARAQQVGGTASHRGAVAAGEAEETARLAAFLEGLNDVRLEPRPQHTY